MKLVWDEAKNHANRAKHGIDFAEAAELFRSGSDYLEIFDAEHSTLEDRFLAIGPLERGIVLVVWTERDEHTIRILSARWATPREQDLYRKSRERHR